MSYFSIFRSTNLPASAGSYSVYGLFISLTPPVEKVGLEEIPMWRGAIRQSFAAIERVAVALDEKQTLTGAEFSALISSDLALAA
jgi:hypothetical protein